MKTMNLKVLLRSIICGLILCGASVFNPTPAAAQSLENEAERLVATSIAAEVAVDAGCYKKYVDHLGVSENIIVWQQYNKPIKALGPGEWDIYMCYKSDLIPVAIADGRRDQKCPAVYGSRIVYLDNKDDDGNISDKYYIWMVDLQKQTYKCITPEGGVMNRSRRESANPAGAFYPIGIYGDTIVWYQERTDEIGKVISSDIYARSVREKDGKLYLTKTVLVSEGASRLYTTPLIYEDKIVYVDHDQAGPSNFYMRYIRPFGPYLNLWPETHIAEAFFNPDVPQAPVGFPGIYDDKIVSSHYKSSGTFVSDLDVYMHLITGGEFLIHDTSRPQLEAFIHENKIAWTDQRYGNKDIYMCKINSDGSISEEIRVTSHAADQWQPKICEDKIYWVDAKDGYYAIYRATVPNKPPVADAGPDQPRPDQTVCVGDTVNFDGSGSYDEDGEILSYVWKFGRHSHATGMITDHIFRSVREYTVTLTVEDNRGAKATDTCTITVKPRPYEVTILGHDADFTGKWFTEGTTIKTPWSNIWVEYNVEAPFVVEPYYAYRAYDVGLYARHYGNLPPPPGYKFQVKMYVNDEYQQPIEIPVQAEEEGDGYIYVKGRAWARIKEKGSYKVKFEWLNDYYDPVNGHDANMQIQKIYIRGFKQTEKNANDTAVRSTGWRLYGSWWRNRTTLYTRSNEQWATYRVDVPVSGRHDVGFTAKTNRDCYVKVYVDRRYKKTILLRKMSEYRSKQREIYLTEGTHTIKYKFVKRESGWLRLYLKRAYINLNYHRSRSGRYTRDKSRWFTEGTTLWTKRSTNWAQYHFNIERSDWYTIELYARNKNRRRLPESYSFDIDVYDVYDDPGQGLTCIKKGRIFIYPSELNPYNPDDYAVGSIRAYLPKGENMLKFIWQKENNASEDHDGDLQIEKVCVTNTR